MAPIPSRGGVEHPSGVRIRRARRGDGEALSALLKELGYPQGVDAQTMNWVISHPEIEIFVAADGADKTVGMVTLSHRPQLRLRGRIGTVDELVVAQAWRGKGVGAQLLKTVVDRARVLSFKRLELVTHCAEADVPRAFYEKSGFALADASVYRLTTLEAGLKQG